MRVWLYYSFIITVFSSSCHQERSVKGQNIAQDAKPNYQILKDEMILKNRFPPPVGYLTVDYDSNSFATYLQNLDLKKYGEVVKYYDGSTNPVENVYCSVVDMDIDALDLQQCADAVMRLRGEFLYEQNRFDEIKYTFISDGKPRYFIQYVNGDFSYQQFRNYMRYVFSYANTASLKAELESHPLEDMRVGDILIQSGNPYGHAVIIVNMAVDSLGQKQFMLAQSYMPAQETQILVNPSSKELTPWYNLNDCLDSIDTPQWTFYKNDLKRF